MGHRLLSQPIIGDLVAQAVSWLVRINLYIGRLVSAVSALLLRFLHCLFGTSPFDNLFIGLNFSFRFLGFLVAAIGFLG